MRVRLLARLCGALYYSPERGTDGRAQRRRRPRSPPSSTIAEATRARRRGAPPGAAGARSICERAAGRLDRAAARWRARPATSSSTLQGHAWLVVDLLEQRRPRRGRRPDRGVHGRGRAAAPAAVSVARGRVAGDAGAAGRQARARPSELAAEALAIGASAEAVTAPQYYAIQVLAIRREQGRMGELEARRAASWWPPTPTAPAWRAALADAAARERAARGGAGRARRAGRGRLRGHSPGRRLDDRDHAARPTCRAGLRRPAARGAAVRAAAAVSATRNVVIGLAAVCLGSAAPLPRAAGGDDRDRASEAVEHFERGAAWPTPALRAPV